MATVNLLPIGTGNQWFTNTGVVLAGGKINLYTAGTTAPAPSWTTQAANVLNANPIILDATGRYAQEIWVTPGQLYKLVFTDANNVVQSGLGGDNIPAINDASQGINAGSIVYTPPGTGAVATTVAARLSLTVYADDFGAKGDGITNSTAAINAAIAALPSGGGTILFSRGAYLAGHVNPFLISNITLQGQGMGSTSLQLIAGTNNDMFTFGNGSTYVRDFYVRDMQLVGNSASQTAANAINFYSAEGCHVLSCEIKDFKNGGILFQGTGTRNSAYLFVSDCYINTNLGDGIYCLNQAYTSMITGNLIAGNGQSPLGGAGFHAFGNDTHRLTGNTFDANSYGVLTNNCSQTSTTGNVFEQNGRTSVIHYGSGHHHTVTGNAILDSSSEVANTYSGIQITDCKYCTISGNMVEAQAIATATGILESGASDYNSISGNTIGGGGAAVTNLITLVGAHTIAANNPGFNPVGIVSDAAPATTVAYTNTHSVPARVNVWAGSATITAIALAGQVGGSITTGLIAGQFLLMPSDTITLTYTGSNPGWKVSLL